MFMRFLRRARTDPYYLFAETLTVVSAFIVWFSDKLDWTLVPLVAIASAIAMAWIKWGVRQWRLRYDLGYQIWEMRDDIEKTLRYITAVKLEKVDITGEKADIDANMSVGVVLKGLQRLGIKIYDVAIMELGDEIHLLYWEAYFADLLGCAQKKDFKGARECVSRHEDDFIKDLKERQEAERP